MAVLTVLDRDPPDLQPPTAATAPPYVVQANAFFNIILRQWLPPVTPAQLRAGDDTPYRYE